MIHNDIKWYLWRKFKETYSGSYSGKEEYDDNNRYYFFVLDESSGSAMIYREFNQRLNIPWGYQ